MIKRHLVLALLTLICIMSLSALPAVTRADGGITIDPTTNNLILNQDDTFEETLTVTVPRDTKTSKVDIYLLADTTSSMRRILTAVQGGATDIVNGLATSLPGVDLAFGLGNYRDFPFGAYAFEHQLSMSANSALIINKIGSWAASGGVDVPEGQFFALDQLASDTNPAGGSIGWRQGAERIVILFGDAPAHDPICPAISRLGYRIDEASVTAKLKAANISVIALSVSGDGLNADPRSGSDYVSACGTPGGSAGQATRITAATGGTYVAGIDSTTIVKSITEKAKALIRQISVLKLQPTGAIAPFVQSITPPTIGPITAAQDHTFKFQAKFKGVKACTATAQVFNGTIDVVADGSIETAKKVTITVPACAPGRWYANENIQVNPYPVKVGVKASLSVKVENLSDVDEIVDLEFYLAGLGVGQWFDRVKINTLTNIPLAARSSITKSVEWYPAAAGHYCVGVNVIHKTKYGRYTRWLQRNLDITPTAPAGCTIREIQVCNPYDTVIDYDVSAINESGPAGCSTEALPAKMTLAPKKCAPVKVKTCVPNAPCQTCVSRVETKPSNGGRVDGVLFQIPIAGSCTNGIPDTFVQVKDRPWYANPAINVAPYPVVAGQETTLSVSINNDTDLTKKVNLEFYVSGLGVGQWFDKVGTLTDVELAARKTTVKSVTWYPATAGHYCVKVKTITSTSVEVRQRNLDILPPVNPSTCTPRQFKVCNPYDDQRTFKLNVIKDHGNAACTGTVAPEMMTLAPKACAPATINICVPNAPCDECSYRVEPEPTEGINTQKDGILFEVPIAGNDACRVKTGDGPWYANPNINVAPYPVRVGEETKLSVTIKNETDTAKKVDLEFYVSGLGVGQWFDKVGTLKDVSLPARQTSVYSVAWYPATAGHYCVKVKTITPTGIEVRQRNLNIAPPVNPSTCRAEQFKVCNPYGTIHTFDLAAIRDGGNAACTGNVTPAKMTLAPGACSTATINICTPNVPCDECKYRVEPIPGEAGVAFTVPIGSSDVCRVKNASERGYDSANIEINPRPVTVGVETTLAININHQADTTERVNIEFYVSGLGIGQWFDKVDTLTDVELAPRSLTKKSITWYPATDGHYCVKVRVVAPTYVHVYQQNLDIAKPIKSGSCTTREFKVCNPYQDVQTFKLNVTKNGGNKNCTGQVTPATLTLAPGACTTASMQICVPDAPCDTCSYRVEPDKGNDGVAFTVPIEGQACPAPKPSVCTSKADLMLVLDSSDSIADVDFGRMQAFAKKLVDSFKVGEDDVHIGIAQFSSQSQGKLEIGLSSDAAAIKASIDAMTHQKGYTDIQEGVQLGQQELTTHGRAGVPRFMILLTDGQHNQAGDPLLEASNAQTAGTEIFVVGIGAAVDRDQLSGIASEPDENHLFEVSDFAALDGMLKSLVKNTCNEPLLDAPTGILGQVTGAPDGLPVEGIRVRIYRNEAGKWVFVTTKRAITDATGHYIITGLTAGEYRIQFIDDTRTYLQQFYETAIAFADTLSVKVTQGAMVENINVMLKQVTPPVAKITTSGTLINNPYTGETTVRIARPKVSDVAIQLKATCSAGATPANVKLLLNTQAYPMSQVTAGSGEYKVTIPAKDLVSDASLKATWTCNGTPTQVAVGNIVLYDPSGLITDAQTGLPVNGATVTLYNVPGWTASSGPGDTGPTICESNLSKAAGSPWSQVAPVTEGDWADPDLPMETTAISPTLNPQITGSDGYYGWDVSAGCWYVEVDAPGYEAKTSSVVGVPSAVTDLHIALDPISGASEPAATPEATEAKPSVEPTTVTEAKPSVEPTTVTEAKPSVEPTTVTEAKPSVEPTTVTEAKPSVEPTTVTEAKPSVEPTTVTEAKPSVEPTSNVKPNDGKYLVYLPLIFN